ncbi:glycine betaine ABC transporter substrate-binding protein [Pseudarthrobacter sp. PvP004]|uniref:glycine betaine ABC transporter substrate-binding protein n=1 Tax=Pseudarthrobacter sp. PvP004 TaxID=2817850 RepID=UPI001AE60A17|nr:glycine betaine ABC transporter substrate-binding protein [Pseudarthrobacter sp. PvP004]
MGNQHRNVDAVRDEITSAIAEVRSVAQLEHDVQRQRTADWLDKQFVGVDDAPTLREAAASALSLYGGNGSFSDVGTAESAHAVDQLGRALRRGRTLFFPVW